jgi:hypothetical protein
MFLCPALKSHADEGIHVGMIKGKMTEHYDDTADDIVSGVLIHA